MPLSRCVTGERIRAPEGSCGTEEGTATVSLEMGDLKKN